MDLPPASMLRMPEQSFNEIILAEIRAEMGRQRVSQRELGRRLHWSSTMTHRRLTGRTPLAAESLQQIAEALGVPVSRLGFPLITTSGKAVRS